MKTALTIREELKRLITLLSEQHGFAIVGETALSGAGASSVTLQSADCRLRFLRDKEHLFADASSNEPVRWYDVNTALEYLNGVRPLSGSFDVIGLQVALAANIGALCGLFGRNAFAARGKSLERFTAMSAAERWAALRDAYFE